MMKRDREHLLELAARHSEQVEETYLGDTFVSHQNHRIFFTWHPAHEEWFFIVHRTGVAATPCYPTLGSRWLRSWSKWDEGIAWGKQLIDSQLAPK